MGLLYGGASFMPQENKIIEILQNEKYNNRKIHRIKLRYYTIEPYGS